MPECKQCFIVRPGQLDAKFGLLEDIFCGFSYPLCWHIKAASSSLRMHGRMLQASGLEFHIVHRI